MVAVPFCGPSYTDKSLAANAQRCVNFFPMRSPTPDDPDAEAFVRFVAQGVRPLVG